MVSLPFALLAVFIARFGNRGGMLSLRKSVKRRLGLKFEKGADGFAPGKGMFVNLERLYLPSEGTLLTTSGETLESVR